MQIKLNPLRTLILIVLIVLIGMGGMWFKFLLTPVVTDDKGLHYVVREGATLNGITDDLYNRQLINHPRFFKLLIKMKRVAADLKSGEYFFAKGTRPTKLLDQLVTGSGMVYHSFTIIPGKTFKEIRAKLALESSFKHTIDNQSDAQIMMRLDHPELKPEGEFFPDTYFFAEGASDIIILKKAFKAMQTKLTKAWQTRAPDLPYKNPYEALIAASIIEKEAYLEEELPIIAGVMVNRLKKNMLLQFDPTVVYGVGDAYTGTLRRSDLLANNPYNTYIHRGLPPTPISMPSLAAINAATHPSKHDYYYFVAKKDRSSQFNKKLDDHNKAVEEVRITKKVGGFSQSLNEAQVNNKSTISSAFFNTRLTSDYLLMLFENQNYSSPN